MPLGRDTLLFALLVMLFGGFGHLTDIVNYDVAVPTMFFALSIGIGGFAHSVRDALRGKG